MRLLAAILLSFLSSHPSYAADAWVARLVCEGGSFVLDGFRTDERGYDRHQVVFRDRRVIEHLSKLTGQSFATNPGGELVLSVDSKEVGVNRGAFRTKLADVPAGPGSLSGIYYEVSGHWIASDRFEADVVAKPHSPGAVPPEFVFVGNWVFNHCEWRG